jgi:hypothetical protein
MHSLLATFFRCLPALAFATSASAAALPPDVLVKSRWMELTRTDYERALARVPEKHRFEFAASPKRVQDLLNGLLVTKTLAAQARSHGTHPAASSFSDGKDDGDSALAAAELRRIEADAARAFDARKSAFEAKAREIYELDREKYRAPEEVRFSDIAVAIKDRGEQAALARAHEARRKLQEGADFAAVAHEFSDDATTRDKGGELPFVSARRMAPDYAKAVFALRIGEISEPIKGPAAYHVVKLEGRKPARIRAFDEVRDEIVNGLRRKYVDDQRELRIRSIHEDPDIQINQAAIDALVNRIDPKLFDPKRPSVAPRVEGNSGAAPK